MTEANEPISLNELSKVLGVNKSTLQYYVNYDLFTPFATVGRMNIFDKGSFINRFKELDKLKRHGISLKQIKEKFDEKNKKREN